MNAMQRCELFTSIFVSYCERHFVILYTQPHYQLNYVRVFVYITDGFTQELGFYYSPLNSETNNL